ncbi:hypothetical protein L9G74_09645 [Shewanella sp. C32]|uniref:Uncharacterized protein n=1 Tax=Shewanella electrica TaxID=515560 RepID=A0ABT2FKA3_9GAMM|nr:hypothetical protein [Shewanella electrica]MCH1924851.1 hypothetical protein [Shewanella electrica]MCS4556703.1 hypothetical protein [Shewanella electrica]
MRKWWKRDDELSGGALIADAEPNYAFDHMSDAKEDYIFLKKRLAEMAIPF